MNITGIIPARYQSSRLPGKPLKDICGKPMIWWVYQQAKKVSELSEVYVATDSEEIEKVCKSFSMNVIMTKDNHPTHIHRLQEVSDKIKSDLYLCICGDEPLIEPAVIKKVIPEKLEGEYIVCNIIRPFEEPTEVVDSGNIKVMTNKEGYIIGLSRSPIPFPYKTIQYKFKKIVGVECYNKAALDFFVSKEKGEMEKIEDVTLLRFLENHIKIKSNLVESESLSVDTEKDLEKVRKVISERNER